MRRSFSLLATAATLGLTAATALASSGTFQGYTYSSFGAATITQFGSDSLRITGIGSSGNDGVSIDISTSMRGDFLVKRRVSGAPVGSYLLSTVLGTVNGIPAQTVSIRREAVTSDPTTPITIRDDFSPIGADHYQFLGYLGRNSVISHTTATGDTANTLIACQKWVEGTTTLYIDGVNMGSDLSDGGWFNTKWPWDFTISPVTDIVATPLSTTALASVSNLSGLSMRGKNIASLTITSLSVRPKAVDVPAASLPAIAFGGVALLVAGIVALRSKALLG